MNFLVNLSISRTFFQTSVGSRGLDSWNNFWLGRAENIQDLMNFIPGKVDNVLLTPLKKAAIWMDPIVEKKEKDRKGRIVRRLEIIANEFLTGFMIFNLDETTKKETIKKARLEIKDPKKKSSVMFYRFNSHPLPKLIKRKLGRPKDEKSSPHGHKGRGEKDHLQLIEPFDEKLFRELEGIKNPMKLRRRFFGIFRKVD